MCNILVLPGKRFWLGSFPTVAFANCTWTHQWIYWSASRRNLLSWKRSSRQVFPLPVPVRHWLHNSHSVQWEADLQSPWPSRSQGSIWANRAHSPFPELPCTLTAGKHTLQHLLHPFACDIAIYMTQPFTLAVCRIVRKTRLWNAP